METHIRKTQINISTSPTKKNAVNINGIKSKISIIIRTEEIRNKNSIIAVPEESMFLYRSFSYLYRLEITFSK